MKRQRPILGTNNITSEITMPISRAIVVSIAVVAGLSGFAGYRWHQYVTNTVTPYDEVGMTLNGIAPAPLNKWGCDRLHESFGNTVPPLNCEAGTGSTWR